MNHIIPFLLTAVCGGTLWIIAVATCALVMSQIEEETP